MKVRFILMISLFVIVIAFICVRLNTTLPLLNTIEDRIEKHDGSLKQVHYIQNTEHDMFVVYETSKGLRFAVLDKDTEEVHPLGIVSLHPDKGLTSEISGSKQLGIFVAYGIISDHRISQVWVNDHVSNHILLDNDINLWFHIQTTSFTSPIHIIGYDRSGEEVSSIRM